jgi:hypothetical protein
MRIPYYSLHWLPRRLSRSQILQSHTGSKTVVLRPLAVTITSTGWPYTRFLASEPSSRKTMRSTLLVTTTKMMPTRMKRTLPSAKTRVRRLPKSLRTIHLMRLSVGYPHHLFPRASLANRLCAPIITCAKTGVYTRYA